MLDFWYLLFIGIFDFRWYSQAENWWYSQTENWTPWNCYFAKYVTSSLISDLFQRMPYILILPLIVQLKSNLASYLWERNIFLRISILVESDICNIRLLADLCTSNLLTNISHFLTSLLKWDNIVQKFCLNLSRRTFLCSCIFVFVFYYIQYKHKWRSTSVIGYYLCFFQTSTAWRLLPQSTAVHLRAGFG